MLLGVMSISAVLLALALYVTLISAVPLSWSAPAAVMIGILFFWRTDRLLDELFRDGDLSPFTPAPGRRDERLEMTLGFIASLDRA